MLTTTAGMTMSENHADDSGGTIVMRWEEPSEGATPPSLRLSSVWIVELP